MISVILLNLIPALVVLGGLTLVCLLPFRLARKPATLQRRTPRRQPVRSGWPATEID